MRQITATPILTDEEAAALAGTKLDRHAYNLLLEDDADVDNKDGAPLMRFRRNVIPMPEARAAYNGLLEAATTTDNRGIAGGKLDPTEVGNLARSAGYFHGATQINPTRYRFKKKDGAYSSTTRAALVNSGIVGFFDRSSRHPYCRMTAFTGAHFNQFTKAHPVIKRVNDLYAELLPEHYARQQAAVQATSADFVIKDTVFTTVTVNKNFQTAVHVDRGDFKAGFGNLVVLRAGHYKGGYFVLPRYGIAVDLNNCDVLLVDVHQWHGNTPLLQSSAAPATRLSLVMYYRENMGKCGNAKEELARAQERTPKYAK